MNLAPQTAPDRASLERLTLGIEEAAQALGVSRRTIYVEMDQGRLPNIKLAGRRLILKADLEAFVAGLKSKAS